MYALSLWIIRFIYYIYNYRLLYYLPMEKMEKLIELLNEYDGKNHWWDYDEEYLTSEEFYEENWDLEIISKKFWFIKWLVESDKIDFHIWSRWEKYLEYPIWSDNLDEVHDYKDIIQRLSISDTPIEDLISYLK